MKKLTYLAVLEPSNTGYGIYFPDLPGCISTGNTIEEAQKNAKEALELHIYGMQEDNNPIPTPSITLSKEDTNGNIITPVAIFPDLVKNEMDNRRVKTNVTIPYWLKKQAELENINYSRLLESSLKEYLNL